MNCKADQGFEHSEFEINGEDRESSYFRVYLWPRGPSKTSRNGNVICALAVVKTMISCL